jgi:hypothetical protein
MKPMIFVDYVDMEIHIDDEAVRRITKKPENE